MFGIHLFNFRSVYWFNAQPWAAKKYREFEGKPSNDCRSPRHLSGVNLCVPHVHVQIIHLCIDVYRYTDTCILYMYCSYYCKREGVVFQRFYQYSMSIYAIIMIAIYLHYGNLGSTQYP